MPRAKRPSELLAPGEYERLLAAQDGHCALCPATGKTRRLHVDHDHKTGQVRGLLCYKCNNALPYWVTAAWLYGALVYLAKTEATETVS